MTRSVTIWRTWESADMAASDQFWPTKTDALEHIKGAYDVTPAMLKADGPDLWVAYPKGELESSVHLETVQVPLTRAGIARALTHIPNR